MFKPIILTLFAFIGISTVSNAQSFAQEVGIIFGPVTLQSDYGERHDLETNVGNRGIGIGLVHFINFSANNNHETFFSEHVKIRSELSFTNTNLEHFGRWVEKTPPTIGVLRLRAMNGKSNILSLGAQGEF